MGELMRRLGNVDGRTSGPTIRRMIVDGRLKASKNTDTEEDFISLDTEQTITFS